MKLIQKNGGVMNGSTRFDFTNYYQVVPEHRGEYRCSGPRPTDFGVRPSTRTTSRTSRGVVKNEVKVNVLNHSYGGFPWIDMPMAAVTLNQQNVYNFTAIRRTDAATLQDAKGFSSRPTTRRTTRWWWSGRHRSVQTLGWIRKQISAPSSPPCFPRPDISEPNQTEEKCGVKEYPRPRGPPPSPSAITRRSA